MARNPIERPERARRPGSSGQNRAAERRRSPTTARIGTDESIGAITLTVMRGMVAAADALGRQLEIQDRCQLEAADLNQPGTQLTECARHYQSALRLFVKDWLRDRRQMAWLVDAASGRTLSVHAGGTEGTELAADVELVLAEDQPLNRLRRRFDREGLGLPVACRWRRLTSDPVLDPAHSTAARAWTLFVRVERLVDRRVRTVRVELLDPAANSTVEIQGVSLPVSADFSAPVALTLGLEQKPAAIAYGLRDASRRSTAVAGFSALTPFGPDCSPLVLLEGAGHSLTTMAQIANEVAGDQALRSRYQVWAYRYPVAVPLLFAARALRVDLTRFAALLEGASGRLHTGRVVLLARGAGAVIARSVLADSGPTVWNAVFAVPPTKLHVEPADRSLVETLFVWKRAKHVDRAVILSEPDNAEALVAGIGARAVQLLQRQTPEFRGAVERIFGRTKQQLHAPDSQSAEQYAEPVIAAIASATLAADRAVLALSAVLPSESADLAYGGSALKRVLSDLRNAT